MKSPRKELSNYETFFNGLMEIWINWFISWHGIRLLSNEIKESE